MNDSLKAHAALFAVALIYGANYSIAREAMSGGLIQPLAFIILRAGSAALLFWFFNAWIKKEPIAKEDWPRIVLCAITGVAVNQTLFFMGLHLTKPINASLIMTTTPILVLIASALLIGEKITWSKISGIILGMAGAALLLLYGKNLEFRREQMLGNFFIFANAVAYGIYLVLVKKLMYKYHPIAVSKWIFLIGSIMVIPLGWNQLQETQWSSFRSEHWAAVAYVLIFTTFLAYLLNSYALAIVNPSVVSIYIYLQPLLTTSIALTFRQDHLDGIKLIAGALIFSGVFLVSRPTIKVNKD
jgi:drug/metabolite transporter (DMT)-like permease